jgi:molybdopterin converting factor subunit 1
MRVTVRLFARLRDVAGVGELLRETRAGETVAGVWSHLVAEFPGLAEHDRSIATAVNADWAARDRILQDGDEVAFLPPVSGG